MSLSWNIPQSHNDPLVLNLSPSSPIFIVGANGSGKSALIQHAVRSLGSNKVQRISAHRQTWMETGTINMTAQNRRQFRDQTHQQEPDDRYRYSEWAAAQRISSVLFDLTAKDNEQARRIADATYAKNQEKIDNIIDNEARIFGQVNELLMLAGLKVTIENSEGEQILARHIQGNESYDVAQMSDGERNALIIAGNVLTVTPGTVLLIDEPERHLHRSIIEPFLSALFKQRLDCPFVVATHEISLPLANPHSRVLILRSCHWDNPARPPASWEIQQLDAGDELPQDLKEAILGSNKRILFTEGEPNSLDFAMYTALFPVVSIRPVSNSDGVIKAVRGLRESKDLHDVEAFGVIDRDDRTDEQVAKFQQEGIYALRASSIESLYYCENAIRAVADWQEKSLGHNANQKAKEAKEKALEALKSEGMAERMASWRSERMVTNRLLIQRPTWKDIQKGEISPIEIQLDATQVYQQELTHFQNLLDDNNLDGIIERYPLRESNVFNEIALVLELSKVNYEKTLISRVKTDDNLASELRKLIQPLSDILIEDHQ